MKLDMVFEGGGAKGIAFLGALAELERRGMEPDRIVGTSAGAIFATLLAAGFDAKSLRKAVARRDEKGGLQFDMTPRRFDILVAAGQVAAKHYFDERKL